MEQFKRPHHQRIAQVLQTLDGQLLREHRCLFAGGTVIALRFGEFRESVDMDFLVSDLSCYRKLRQMLTNHGIQSLVIKGKPPLIQGKDMRADQYGIRTLLMVDNQPIKFEIVLEARIELETPKNKDQVCNVPTLTLLDMATSKLLANTDRWADDGAFSRDIIDLALMRPTLALLREALTKAEMAYGDAVRRDLGKAITQLQDRQGWLERCMQVMAMDMPKAQVWQDIRALRKIL
ncbi:MAG: nucleotidyl transferase AbiEii/AbiGii toxin family protein [Ghiorsea sp.]